MMAKTVQAPLAGSAPAAQTQGAARRVGVPTSAAGRYRVNSKDRAPVTRKTSRATSAASNSADIMPSMKLDGPAFNPDGTLNDDYKWINRDKLAVIESMELAEMDPELYRALREENRVKSMRASKSTGDMRVPSEDGGEENVSPIQDEDDDPWRYYGEERSNNTTKPLTRPNGQTDHDIAVSSRPGTSRIPIPASKPASYDDDDSPLEISRQRSGSTSMGMQQQRARSKSSGTQPAFQQADGKTTPRSRLPSISTTPQGSPPKEYGTSKGNGTPTKNKTASARKPSGTQPRSRAGSTDTSKRPTTSDRPRPPTARPEGEAPWIATMYKPDPRLPPDQQMLPTHAKRLAQEQAEAEARAARDAEQSGIHLANEEPPDVNASAEAQEPSGPPNVIKAMESPGEVPQTGLDNTDQDQTLQPPTHTDDDRLGQSWPLSTSGEAEANGHPPSSRTISPAKEYNIMPRVPSQQDRRFSSNYIANHQIRTLGHSTEQEREANAAQAPVHQPITLQPPKAEEGKEKKKGGCGCCVVM